MMINNKNTTYSQLAKQQYVCKHAKDQEKEKKATIPTIQKHRSHKMRQKQVISQMFKLNKDNRQSNNSFKEQQHKPKKKPNPKNIPVTEQVTRKKC